MADVKQADLFLSGEALRIKSYQRGTTDDMIARFGSSESGQSNLDLLKASTQKSFRGGMFQKNFVDPEMAAYVRKGHYNPLDDRLYFTPAMSQTIVTGDWSDDGVTAWCLHAGRIFFASRNTYGTQQNSLYMLVLSTGVTTKFTLPALVANSTAPISSIIAKDDRIFLCGKSNTTGGQFAIYRGDYSTTAGVFTGLTTTTTFRKICWYRDKMYAIGLGYLHLVNNPKAGTATFTKIKIVGNNPSDLEDVQDMFEYNGALYVTKVDGLYRYDGVDVNLVFNYQNNASQTNFQYQAIFNGRLYFNFANKLYRFDGINVEMIQDFSDAYTIMGLAGGSDRLWITVRYNESSSSVYTSPNFTDPVNINVYKYALITWNDVGFFEYDNEIYRGDYASSFSDYAYVVKPVAMPVNNQIFWFFPYNWMNGSLEGRSNGFYYKKANLSDDYNYAAVPVGRKMELYGSVFDAGFPAVAKTLNGFMVNYDSDDSSKLLLTFYVRYVYQGVKTDWVEIWNNTNVTSDGVSNDYLLHNESTAAATNLTSAPLVYDYIEYKGTAEVLATLTQPLRIKDVSYRYTIQPRTRLRWQLSIPLYGSGDALDPSYFTDGTKDTRSASYLRRMIYNAYKNKLPVLFYDIDFTRLKAAVADLNVDTLTVAGRDFLASGDFVAVKTATGFVNRKIKTVAYDAGTNQTTFKFTKTGLRRVIGAANDTAASADAEVRKSYAVYVTKVQNERVIIDPNTVNNTDGYSDFQSELVIDLIEV